MTKRIPLAVALAAFAMACSDSTSPGAVPFDAPSLDVTTTPGYPFPIGDGDVQLCKTADAAGTFTFNVSVNGGTASQVQITLNGAGTACAPNPIFHSTKNHNDVDNVDVLTITEVSQPDWTLTDIDIIRYLDTQGVPYGAGEMDDSENNVTATVKINHDMARRVVFENDFDEPEEEPEICDFVTFGRLVLSVGGKKVVISGNIGGNQPGGGFLNEFHVDANGVDNHVADIDTYGPIAAGPLSGLTNSRMATGTAKNGVDVEIRVWDGGEPGGGADRVYIKLDGVELLGANGQLIDMGNMQYHATCRGPKS